MKLFAENEHEKQLLDGLCNLLFELGISAEGYMMNSVYAPIFWTAADLDIFSYSALYLTTSEKEYFLHSIEEPLHIAMTTAGYEIILKELMQFSNSFSCVR